MLDKAKFVVKEQVKLFSSKTYDIVDADSGQSVGTATDKTGFMAKLFGAILGEGRRSISIEVRQKPDDALVFTVRRSGMLFPKVRVLDAQGKILGSYKAKFFSLSGGFVVYDKDGKPFADIKGKMFKAAYQFFTPDGKKEMGSVSKKWGGMTKELLTSAGTFGVQIEPAFATDQTAKILILGATIALDAIFKKKGGTTTKTSEGETDKDSDE